MATDAAQLRKAASLLDKRGHVKGHLEDAKGRVCMMGAINLACTGDASNCGGRSFDLLDRVERYLQRKFKKRYVSAIEWNNMASRRKSQVVEALREAARFR